MASDSEDPDGAATRLEAALERIAAAVARSPTPVAMPEVPAPVAVLPDVTVPTAAAIDPEAIARLDSLIDRLRGVLAGHAA
jgi:hypothetical protein